LRGRAARALTRSGGNPYGGPVIGERLGNYRVVRQLGEGGMGVVYLAEHELLRRKAALKVLHTELGQSRDVLERFLAEAQATAALKHPGIVEILDCGFHTTGQAYIVMEFLEGCSLGHFLAERGRLPIGDIALVGQQIAAAVGTAHAHRLVHRDLKPENVFLVERRLDRVKVLDFGIAKLLGDTPGSKRTRTGMVLGTPAYMSPEQCRGVGEIDHRADIYSLGCVLYEMGCGRLPFLYAGTGELIAAHLAEAPPPPRALVPLLSPAFDGLVLRMLSKSAADRPASMQVVSDELERLAAAAPAQTRPPTARTVKLEAPAQFGAKQPDTTLGGAARGSGVVTPARRGGLGWAALALLLVVGGGVYAVRAMKDRTTTEAPVPARTEVVEKAEPLTDPVKPEVVQPEPAAGKKKPGTGAKGKAAQVVAQVDSEPAQPAVALAELARHPPFGHKARALPPLSGEGDDPVKARLAGFIDCLNEVSPRARNSYERYHSWVKDLALGPTGQEKIIYGLYTLNGVESCHERIGATPAGAPEPVERAATAFDRTMSRLDAVTKKMDRYYEQEDFKDDGFAEGKRMHGPLLAAFHHFSEADQRLRAAIEGNLPKKARPSGGDGSPLGRKDALMEAAEAVMRAAEEPAADKMAARVADYGTALEKTRQAGEAAKAEDNIFWWEPFLREADGFLVVAKRRARTLREGENLTTGEKMLSKGGGAWMVKGSAAELERAYGQVVSSARNVKPH
jgi:hypothetical protein